MALNKLSVTVKRIGHGVQSSNLVKHSAKRLARRKSKLVAVLKEAQHSSNLVPEPENHKKAVLVYSTVLGDL